MGWCCGCSNLDVVLDRCNEERAERKGLLVSIYWSIYNNWQHHILGLTLYNIVKA